MLNGSAEPEPITLRAGTSYRFRFMNITLGAGSLRLRLVRAGFPVRWVPIAKDGYDLSDAQRRSRLSEEMLAVGETLDVRFSPEREGELHLELRRGNGALLVDQPVRVIP